MGERFQKGSSYIHTLSLSLSLSHLIIPQQALKSLDNMPLFGLGRSIISSYWVMPNGLELRIGNWESEYWEEEVAIALGRNNRNHNEYLQLKHEICSGNRLWKENGKIYILFATGGGGAQLDSGSSGKNVFLNDILHPNCWPLSAM